MNNTEKANAQIRRVKFLFPPLTAKVEPKLPPKLRALFACGRGAETFGNSLGFASFSFRFPSPLCATLISRVLVRRVEVKRLCGVGVFGLAKKREEAGTDAEHLVRNSRGRPEAF